MDSTSILSRDSQMRLRSIQVLCDAILENYSSDKNANHELLSELNCISACIEILRVKNYVLY